MSDDRGLFPDFFTTKDPIPTKVTVLDYNGKPVYVSTIATKSDESEPQPTPTLKPYMDNDEEMIDCADVENYDIISTKSGTFQTSLYVPSCLLSFIIGAKGSRLKSLQKDTNTLIKVPRINEKGDVIIVGDSERKVVSARTQISIIVAQRRERMKPTHFIAIPIDSEQIRENLLKFKNSVLENPPTGVTESVFQKTVKIHLTVSVLVLLDENEVVLAKKTLQSCYDDYISQVLEKNKKHMVTIQGLEIMNDDPSKVYVLYAKVHMKDVQLMEKLQEICDTILNYFYRAGLSKKEYDRVKLHMTLMNTSFRDSDEKKVPFDTRKILEMYKDFYFGEFELKELHLCIRGTTTSSSGQAKYYDTALRVPM